MTETPPSRVTEDLPLEPPVEVAPSALSSDALEGLIREFLLTQGMGSEPGENSDLDASIAKVKQLLAQGRGKILFDPTSSSCSLEL